MSLLLLIALLIASDFALILAGIFEYSLPEPFDVRGALGSTPVELTTTNRDGSLKMGGGKWAGQEGVCFDNTVMGTNQYGKGIWSVSEHHKKLYYLRCLDA